MFEGGKFQLDVPFDGQSEVEEQIWQQPFSVLNLLLKFAEPSSKLTHYSLIVPQLSVDGRVSENSHYERTECTRTTELGSLSSQWVARHTPSGRNVYYTLPAASNTIPVVHEDSIDQVKEEVLIQSTCGHNPFIATCFGYWQSRHFLFIGEERSVICINNSTHRYIFWQIINQNIEEKWAKY
ncbi:hypothetical protein J6590_045999 [Homalodisca vitripennis]|nr:hypothetical protein J6590_045999 [Homalodisca vitripennis]